MSQVQILSPRPLILKGFPPPRGENPELGPSKKCHVVLVLVRVFRVDFHERSGSLPNVILRDVGDLSPSLSVITCPQDISVFVVLGTLQISAACKLMRMVILLPQSIGSNSVRMSQSDPLRSFSNVR
jgi:hypothetical protein